MRTFFDDVSLEYEEARGGAKGAAQLFDDTNLAERLGAPHARRRLLTEREVEALEGRANPLQLLRFKMSQVLIRAALTATGQYSRGLRNAARVEVRRNRVLSPRLPKSFCGFTILHLSDLHVDMSEAAMAAVASLVKSLEYDFCVITGDFRGETFGPFDQHACATRGDHRRTQGADLRRPRQPRQRRHGARSREDGRTDAPQ